MSEDPKCRTCGGGQPLTTIWRPGPSGVPEPVEYVCKRCAGGKPRVMACPVCGEAVSSDMMMISELEGRLAHKRCATPARRKRASDEHRRAVMFGSD